MDALTPHRRAATRALTGALVVIGMAPVVLAGQQGCVFGEEGNEVFQRQTLPGGGTITYVTRPHFVCDDGVQIWADSAVAYSADGLSHLLGAVRFLDGSRELTSNEARYFSNVARLQANGDVVAIDRTDGSRVENGDLVYLRETDFRAEASMTVTTGADGVRPRAIVPPPPDTATVDAAVSDSVAPPSPNESPYTVVGDRIVFEGASYFSSTGDVEIERDSLFAYADSAEYVAESERLVLVGSASVVSAGYVLVGRTITMGTAADDTNEIRAVREALLTGEDLTLRAPLIRLYLREGAVERLVAVPIPDGAGPEGDVATPDLSDPTTADSVSAAGGPDRTALAGSLPIAPPDSTTLQRPVAISERFELTADSLELNVPGEVVDRIFAAGRARSVSEARDTLNVELLPELARHDWLEGDTIVITLLTPDSTAPPPETDEEREYEIDRIVARVGARSLYRMPPQDSAAQAGVDMPAVHYVLGDEITIHMREGEVEAMEVVGQTRGVHLEPLGPAGAAVDSIPADSIAPDSAGVGAGGPVADTTRVSSAVPGREGPPFPHRSRPRPAAIDSEPWRRP